MRDAPRIGATPTAQGASASAAAKALLFGMCFLGAQVCRAQLPETAPRDTHVRTADIDRALASLLPPSPAAQQCPASSVSASSGSHLVNVATFTEWVSDRISYGCPRAPLQCAGEPPAPCVTDALPTQDDVLHAALRAAPSAETDRASPSQRDATARRLVSRVDPVMARSDARAVRFGSLDWALARIGDALTGDESSNWATSELVAVALAMLPERHDTRASATFFSRFMPIVTRMALANDVIEPHEAERLDTRTRARVIAYFRWRMQDALGQGERLAAAANLLPTRRDVAREQVASAGVPPDVAVHVKSHKVFVALWNGAVYPIVFRPCMGAPGTYTPVELLMHDCLSDLKRDAPQYYARLSDADVTHNRITELFEARYATAIPTLAHTFLMPMLQARIDTLNDTDRAIWRCGDWTLHRAMGTPAMQPVPDDAGGVLGVVLPDEAASKADEIQHFTLLMSIQHPSGAGAGQTRHYLITPSTLQVVRLNGDLAARLNSGEAPFVAVPREAGGPRDRSGRAMCVDTVTRAACGATVPATQGAAEILAAPFHALHDAAFAMTATEAEHAARREALLGLLPFYRCVQDVRAARQATVFDCATDLLGLLPLADAGLDASLSAMHLLTALGPDEWLAWSEQLMVRGLPALRENTPAQLAHWLDVAARDGMRLAGESARLFDPGFAAMWHLSTGVAGSAEALFERLARMPLLRRHLPALRARLDALPVASESRLLNQLCRSRRSPTSVGGACSQLSGFGGYVRPYPHSGGETRFQFDAGSQTFERFNSHDAAMRTVVVDDMTDGGELAEREYLLIGDHVVWRHIDAQRGPATSGKRARPGAYDFLMSLSAAFGKDPRYVVVDVPVVTTGGHERTLQIAARYATFADQRGCRSSLVQVQGADYVFKIDRGWEGSPVAESPITVYKATEADVNAYKQFMALLRTPYEGEIVLHEGVPQYQLVASMPRLVQARIKRMTLRMQRVQHDALIVLRDPMRLPEVELLLQRFTPLAQVATLHRALIEAIEAMTNVTPRLIQHYRTRIAVALMVDPALPATATVNGLSLPLSYKRANVPVIYLNELGLDSRTTESLAGVLLQQMTRASLGALNQLAQAPELPATLAEFGGLADLSPLLAVAHSVPPDVLVRHAPTLEQLIFLSAYLHNPMRADGVRSFSWASTDSYWRMTLPDGGGLS
ncbi:hypothetical protein ACPWR0_07905 [Pandoraea pneumonica]|uniref:hypothetical protein n=1 Tax=Pandoraea pneumonica TaxID=2508299 RepID=UPI003CF190B4